MLKRISESLPALSKAEREVANWILKNPQETLDCVISQMAENTGVSEPTIIRFCRTLGCSGFKDFKLSLAQSKLAFYKEIKRHDSSKEIIDKIAGSAIASLQHIRNQLDESQVKKAIRLLRNSSRIEFYGQGGSGIVAKDAQQKFFRFGIACNVYTDPYIHSVSATLLDHECVVVAISHSGRSIDIVESCRLAQQSRAKVIAITASPSPLAELADVLLDIDIDEDSDHYAPIKSRMAQLLVLDILSVGYAVEDEGRIMGKLYRAAGAVRRKHMENHDPPVKKVRR